MSTPDPNEIDFLPGLQLDLGRAERCGFPEVLAYTNLGNLRSQAVMRRLDMRRREDLDFDYPGEAEDSPMRQAVVYSIAPA